jgi:hypothetical protein
VSQQYLDYDIVDLKWSNKVPSIYTCVASDGRTQVKSMEGGPNDLTYAPKWYKPPVAAHFSPDGTLVSFREN